MKFYAAIAALAVLAAPALAANDVLDAAAPEATPVMNARMYEFLDESAHVLSARDAANVAYTAEESNGSFGAALIAVPCVAAAVGVAGFAAYKVKRNTAAQSSVSLSA